MRRRPFRPTALAVLALTAGLVTALPPATGVAVAAPAVGTPVPTAAGSFVALTPARVLDTRTGNGAPKGQVVSGRPVHLTVTGRGGVPENGVVAVVLTLTVTGSRAPGYLTAFPTGSAAPLASVSNWGAGQVVAGQATVTVGALGQVDLVPHGSTVDLVADVAGYVLGGTPTQPGTYAASSPTRLLDTRTGNGAPQAPVRSGGVTHLAVAGRGPVPTTGASAVVVTLTATRTTAAGYLTAYPGGTTPATTSTLNWAKGATVANQATVQLGADGSIDLRVTGSSADLVADVTGYVLAGTPTAPGTYVALPPGRVLDTRQGGGGGINAPFPVQVSGRGGIPATGVGAVVANLTVTSPRSQGYLTAYPDGRPRPLASNLNWRIGDTVANQATLPLGRGGRIDLVAVASADYVVVVDVSGYYLPATPAAPTGLRAQPSRSGNNYSVALSWTPSTDAVEGYTVRRAVGTVAPATPSAGDAVAEVGPDVAAGTDTGVGPSTTYSYAVFAHDDVPNAGTPATVTVTTPAPDTTPPGPDTALTASNIDVTSLALTWTPPTDADYRTSIVRRAAGTVAPTSPTDGVAVGTASTTAAFAGGLSSGSTYTFAVFARDSSGNIGPASNPVTVTTVGTADVTGLNPANPAGSTDPQNSLDAVDCPPAGGCVTVGSYRDETSARHTLLMLVVVGTDAPHSHAVPLPVDADPAGTPRWTGLSCPTATSCTGVGTYTTVSPAGADRSFVTRWDGTTAVTTPLPSSAAEVSAEAVDCADSTSCTAVGWTDNGHGGAPWIARLADGTWSELPAATPVGAVGGRLETVSCATAASCGAGGVLFGPTDAGLLAVTSPGNGWSLTTAPLPGPPTPSGDGGVGVDDVVCPAAGYCVAAGRYGNGSDFEQSVGLYTLAGGAWTVQAAPVRPAVSQEVDVACSPTRCSVLVTTGVTPSSNPTSVRFTRTIGASTWTAQTTTRPGDPAGSAGLDAIACDAAGRCAGSGDYVSADKLHGLVGAFGPAQNSATAVEPQVPSQLGGAVLERVACDATGHCAAIGNYIAGFERGWIASFRIVGG